MLHTIKIGRSPHTYPERMLLQLFYMNSVKACMSKVYHLQRVQVLNISLDKAWHFFSDPANLANITPAKLGFNIITSHAGEMYAGQIIEYTVKPLLGIPVYWMTEITHVRDREYFIDEQRIGPYALWHHQHHFKEVQGGVEMTDIVHYRVPFWFLGNVANSLFVRSQLKEIFDYRFRKAEELFGTPTAARQNSLNSTTI